jgi:hypothetical protein
MPKPTSKQIGDEIKALKQILPTMPKLDGNEVEVRPAIEAQIRVLEKRMTKVQVGKHFGFKSDAYLWGYIAVEWLETGQSQCLKTGKMSTEWPRRVSYESACVKYHHDCKNCPCYPYWCY